MRGTFDVSLLRDALTEVVAQHESLRSVFVGGGRKLTQRVCDPAPVDLIEVDLSGEQEPEAALKAAIAQDLSTRIDPARGPLRVTLWRIAEDDHVLCLNMHHLVTDSWSCGVVFQDLCAAFDRAGGGSAELAEPGWQYQRFVAAQEAELTGDGMRRLHDYWRRQLDGMQLPALPLAPEEAGRTGRRTALIRANLDKDTVVGLRDLARTGKTTLFVVLLSVYYTLLYRCTDNPDVAVASLFANRSRREVRRTVGFLANMVILRTRLTPGGTFAEQMRATHSTVIDGFLHQALPYQMLPLSAERSGQRADDVVFQMLADSVYTTTSAGVEIEVLVPDGVGSRFEFELVLVPEGEGFRVLLFYDADRLDAVFAAEFVDRFVVSANTVAKDPDVAIARL